LCEDVLREVTIVWTSIEALPDPMEYDAQWLLSRAAALVRSASAAVIRSDRLRAFDDARLVLFESLKPIGPYPFP